MNWRRPSRLLWSFCKTPPKQSVIYNYFQILEVPVDANEVQIKQSYLDLVKKYHPDLNPGESTAERFRLIQEAYQILSDFNKRSHYRQQHKKMFEVLLSEENQAEMDDFEKRMTSRKVKEDVNEEVQLSYKLFTTHYDKIQKEKQKYIRYSGYDGEYYEHMDTKGFPWYVVLGVPLGSCLLIYFAVQFTNIPKPSRRPPPLASNFN